MFAKLLFFLKINNLCLLLQDERGYFVYRYLFVELDDFGRHAIILEDNRETKSTFSKGDFDISHPFNLS